YIRAWHAQAEPLLKEKDFDTTELMFEAAWSNSKEPLTDELFADALKEPDPEWLKREFMPAKMKNLLKVCIHLQKRWGDEPFFLSARTAGRAVGVHHEMANKYLQRLVKRGFLVPVEKGSSETRNASTWRFVEPRV